jgi:hypothetical protein
MKRYNANQLLLGFGQSPLKMHTRKGKGKLTYAKRKIDDTVEAAKSVTTKRIARALRINPTEVFEVQSHSKEDLDFECFINDLEKKIQSSTFKEQVSLLSLAPRSWSVKKVSEIFHVSDCEYQVQLARHLQNSQNTILPIVETRKGPSLPESTKSAAVNCYDDDGVSRLCSGVKETV